MDLTSKQRKYLEKEAHGLSPVVIVGAAGVSEGIIKMVDSSLTAHELIKVKFNEYKDEKVELTDEICKKNNAILVRIIGNIAIIYRAKEEIEGRNYEKNLNKIATSET